MPDGDRIRPKNVVFVRFVPEMAINDGFISDEAKERD